jgi:hypothetical protein
LIELLPPTSSTEHDRPHLINADPMHGIRRALMESEHRDSMASLKRKENKMQRIFESIVVGGGIFGLPLLTALIAIASHGGF